MHLHQLPSKRWRVIVKANGRQRTATADKRAEAQRLGAQLLLTLGGAPHQTRSTVGDILAIYQAARRQRWSVGYRADVAAIIERLPTSFTERPAASIRPSTIDALDDQLESRGWKIHSRRRVHEILSAAWSEARRRDVAVGNPTADVPKPSANASRITVPTAEQIAAILAATTGPEHLALRIAATLGIRRGEIVALQWRDINLHAAEVTIRRSLAYAPADGVVEGDTKTGVAAHRVLAVDPDTCTLLADWHTEQTTHQRSVGVEQRWVFSDNGGIDPWRPDRLTHTFADARKQAGIEGIRLHDLRHYVATTMLGDGETLLDTAHQLGHTSPSTTERVYAHFLPGRGRESVNKRAARLRSR